MIDMADFQALVEEVANLEEQYAGSPVEPVIKAKTELADYVIRKYPEFIRMYEESCGLRPKG